MCKMLRGSSKTTQGTLLTLGLTLGIALAAGCAATGSRTGTEAIERITDRLVDAVELRADVRALRVCVHWIHELNPDTGAPMIEGVSQHGGGNVIGTELQHRFIDALSNRMNVVEFELAENEDPELMSGGMQGLMETFGVTHVLVGDFVRRGGALDVSVRLVDAGTLLIVASANGIVPIEGLSDEIRDALDEKPMYRISPRSHAGVAPADLDHDAAGSAPDETSASPALSREADAGGPAAYRLRSLGRAWPALDAS